MTTASGRAWPTGGTPPMPNPVVARTSSAPARRTGRPRCAARRSVSRRFAPETSARSGSWSAMKTSDLTMRPTVVPTAAAACSAGRVLCAHSITVVCTPAAASASATRRADAFIVPPRELSAIGTQPPAGSGALSPIAYRLLLYGRKGAPLLLGRMVPLEEAHAHGVAVARRCGARGYFGGAGAVDAGLIPVEHLAQ